MKQVPGITIRRQTRFFGVWIWECQSCPANLSALSYIAVCRQCVTRSAVAHVLRAHSPRSWVDTGTQVWWWDPRDALSEHLTGHAPHLEAR